MTMEEWEQMKKEAAERLALRLKVRDIKIGELTGTARRYEGVGHLNVLTSRGEVKAQSGDYIVTLGDIIFVVPEALIEKLSPEATPPWSEGKEPVEGAEEPPAEEPPAQQSSNPTPSQTSPSQTW
jgi:hypothetical protein